MAEKEGSSKRARRSRAISSNSESTNASTNGRNIDDDDQENSDASSRTSDGALAGPSNIARVLAPPPTENGVVPVQNFQLQTDLRRQYSELIETCQGYRDKDGIETDLQEMMTKNIKKGSRLFSKIGGGPGDMYMAFLHTKMCSGMILSKTEKIGSSSSGFTLEGFLNSFLEKCHGEFGEYSPSVATKLISQDACLAQRTFPTLVAIIGSFDRDSILTPPEAKEKKPRATPRKKMLDSDENATHHEEVNMTDEQRAMKDKDSPETQAKAILSILTDGQKSKKAPSNLVEFTMNRSSLPNYFENLFYVSFLVRDGFVSIRRRKRKHGDNRKFDSDLVIAPEKPPTKHSQSQDDSSTRNQHIVSFNARQFKALARASKGAAMITPTKPKKSREGKSK